MMLITQHLYEALKNGPSGHEAILAIVAAIVVEFARFLLSGLYYHFVEALENLRRRLFEGLENLSTPVYIRRPRTAESLMRLCMKGEQAEADIGDCRELFERDIHDFGPAKATRLYWYRALLLSAIGLIDRVRRPS